MDIENNTLEKLLTMFPMLNFTEEKPEKPMKNKPKTLEEVLEEFPCLNYDYGTASYYAHKYPYLPDEAYEVLEEVFNANQNRK
jgi:hypothetical protein